MSFMIITDKDEEKVMEILTEKKIWVEDIKKYVNLHSLLDEKAPHYKQNEVMGVLVPEKKKPKYEPVEEIIYNDKYLSAWKKWGVELDRHPVGFAIVVLNKTKKDKRLKKNHPSNYLDLLPSEILEIIEKLTKVDIVDKCIVDAEQFKESILFEKCNQEDKECVEECIEDEDIFVIIFDNSHKVYSDEEKEEYSFPLGFPNRWSIQGGSGTIYESDFTVPIQNILVKN